MWPFSSPASDPAPSADPPASACPVDPAHRESWLQASSSSSAGNATPSAATGPAPPPGLSTQREVSSIPRWLPPASSSPSSSSPPPPSDAAAASSPPSACPMHEAERAAADPSQNNWVYPSPASFYSALERKNRNPDPRDMGIIVPIHNAVNERVWDQVLAWERDALGLAADQDPGSKLVSFVGKPQKLTPRARWKSWIGYTAPFDRHDWLVDRPLVPPSSSSSSSSDPPPSIRVRYVIDFYTGRGAGLMAPPPPPSSSSSSSGPAPAPEANLRPNLAFFIDCRPALDGWEGVRMRFNRYWGLGAPEADKRT